MGELIQLKDWEAERKRKAIQESVQKIKNAIKNVEEFLKDADFNRESEPGNRETGEHRIAKYHGKPTDKGD